MRKLKQSLLVIALLAVSAWSFAAGKTEEKTGTAPAADKNITLTIAASQNWLKEIDREISKDFTAETGIKIDIQVNPDDQYPAILQTKMNTGETPDIFYYSAGLTLKKLPLDKVLDLSQEPWAKRMKDWAVKGSTIDGRLVALNLWSVDGWAFVYNTALFDKLGLKAPTNYSELLAVCETIKKNGVVPIYELVGDMWHTPLYLNQAAADASMNNPGLYEKLNTNKAKFAEIKEFQLCVSRMKEMADKGYLGETYMSNTWTNAIEAVGTGKYAMFLGYTSWQNEVARDYPQSGANNFKMFPSPLGVEGTAKSFATSAGGTVALINKDSKNVEAAKKYFEYRTRPEVLKKYYDQRPDLNSNPSFPEVEAKPTVGLSSISKQVNNNFLADAQAGVLFYDLMPIGEEMQSMFAGVITPEQALKNIDAYRAKIGKSAGITGF